MIRVLTFTNLYPNPVQPRHGIFVEQRLRRIVATGRVHADVVAPVPWFPIFGARLRRFREAAQVPPADARHGIRVVHPRFAVVPGVSHWLNPLSMAAAGLAAVRRLRAAHGDFDVIDAHFLYPDAAAAMLIGLRFGKPVLVTARGSDVNLLARGTVARWWILWTARHCASVITVSAALKASLVELGVDERKITVLRNGVDLDMFQPRERKRTRSELGLDSPTLLSVGNLVPEKGHDLVIDAIVHLPSVRLVLIGTGADEARLRRRAEERRVADRIVWISHVPQAELARYYSAADLTVLASSREGMPNVVLESLACGTRVVASAVGGVPEVVVTNDAGSLVQERTADEFSRTIARVLREPVSPDSTRRFAERFGWAEPVNGHVRLLERAVAIQASRDGTRPRPN